MLKAVRPASTPPLSAERAALASAIAALAEAERAHNALKTACNGGSSPAEMAVATAHETLAAANKALLEAQQNEANALVAKALGQIPVDFVSVERVRQTIQNAEDRLAAAREARDTLRARVQPSAEALIWKRNAVENAAAEVIKAEVGPLAENMLADFAALEARWRATQASLNWLAGRGALANPPPQHWHGKPTAWAAAFAALQRDATAPLPLD
jgi:hypothetical protein